MSNYKISKKNKIRFKLNKKNKKTKKTKKYFTKIKFNKISKKNRKTKKTSVRKKMTKKKFKVNIRNSRKLNKMHKIKNRKLRFKRGGGVFFTINPNLSQQENKINLKNFLIKNGISENSINSWGLDLARKTKTLDDLYLEIQKGDSILQVNNNKVIRLVKIVVVQIYKTKSKAEVLVEDKHESSEGKIKEKNTYLSEKMMPNETVEQAARRGINEELGGIANKLGNNLLIIGENNSKTEIKNSLSYPGLMAKYKYHFIEGVIPKLTDKYPNLEEQFTTQEFKRDGSLKRIIHWKWMQQQAIHKATTPAFQKTTSNLAGL